LSAFANLPGLKASRITMSPKSKDDPAKKPADGPVYKDDRSPSPDHVSAHLYPLVHSFHSVNLACLQYHYSLFHAIYEGDPKAPHPNPVFVPQHTLSLFLVGLIQLLRDRAWNYHSVHKVSEQFSSLDKGIICPVHHFGVSVQACFLSACSSIRFFSPNPQYPKSSG
jgi:hypothetical protein